MESEIGMWQPPLTLFMLGRKDGICVDAVVLLKFLSFVASVFTVQLGTNHNGMVTNRGRDPITQLLDQDGCYSSIKK
ncbi:Oxysterol-binding protein-related protein 8 [Manis javanica]|nr:Oxysterol-binding protein-related protein 8 [Manis javanica]